MRPVAALLALAAVACLALAIKDMAEGTDAGRRGWVLRVAAVACFAVAVALNVLSR